MRTAIRLALAGLAWSVWLSGGPSFAQHGSPFVEEAVGPGTLALEAEDGPAGALDSGRVFDEPMADPRAAFADASAPQLPSACCEVCGGGSACPKRWALGSGTRIFSRSRPREIILTSELSAATGRAAPVMSNRNHGFDPSAGYYATIKRYLGRDEMNRDHFLEFTYWGLTNWQTSDQRAGERLSASGVAFGSLFSPFAPTTSVFTSQVGGFNRADRHVIESATELHSFELEMHLVPRNRQDRLVLLPNGKWRRECNPGQYFSGSFGLRYMIIDDRFDFASEAMIQTQQGTGVATGLYDVNTRNHLIGLQFGADVMWRQCRGEWGFRAKAGPYFNFASQDSRVTTDAAAENEGTKVGSPRGRCGCRRFPARTAYGVSGSASRAARQAATGSPRFAHSRTRPVWSWTSALSG